MKTIAILARNDIIFTITQELLGYYTLRVDDCGNIEVFKSPDLSELIGKCIDKSI